MIIIDEAIKLINKFIPDKTNQQQIEKELRELDIKEYEAKKSLIDKIIPITFPLLVWVMSMGLLFNVLAPWISLIFKCETPIYIVDNLHFELIRWFMVVLFGKKTIEKFSNK